MLKHNKSVSHFFEKQSQCPVLKNIRDNMDKGILFGDYLRFNKNLTQTDSIYYPFDNECFCPEYGTI